jgi:hypothetical protein
MDQAGSDTKQNTQADTQATPEREHPIHPPLDEAGLLPPDTINTIDTWYAEMSTGLTSKQTATKQ